ncbi:uncharacterized protein K460DRAFT_377687 [Cucurbitaria berberidis CBS 394.84]|uniref:Uncharacterized protein n=1 Tax=Cucurbitaria berberidis CBS 394.84 TaxID=1168544 RepID=A0A9P4GJZ5_9PLEO|nr:uncharacterized protein K460DRAFT_377687 [Cucurbitaria berberidis CBS 394.84]KAF1846505.1 hypothetical protein K460DRAFT_377687 [Cucurbitaria berberidis CBS 394.84]
MSLPTPHIQALSTYKTHLRAPSSQLRNVSSPYGLAIPPTNKRRSTNISTISETPTERANPARKSVNTLRVPTPPKKAVLVSEKPIQPCASNDRSTSTTSSQYKQASPYPSRPKKARFGEDVDDRVLALAVTLGIVLLLAIIIPLGIILPQKLIKPLPVNVLVPLYMKPELGGWDKMYAAILKYSDTNFTVIINPDNGPGSDVWPPGVYIEAIKNLNAHTNVQTLGYVNTTGGTRDNATVRADIAKYAGWADVSADLGMQGIYFDETPWQYSDDARAYMKNISATVRHSQGFGNKAMVVQNPGRVPDEGLMAYKPDLTVVFEGAYEDLPRKTRLHNMLDGVTSHRKDRAMLVHSVPKDLGTGGLRKIVDDVRRDVECVSAYPNLEFLVIVNPSSGPGVAPWWPNADYIREIPRLNAYKNVKTVGYVRVGYCKRPEQDVAGEIDAYAARSRSDEHPGLGMEGIFVDETVNHYSKEAKRYLDAIDRKVKECDGIHGDRIMVHNPGTAVHAQLASPGPDITVVVETSYGYYVTDEYQNWLATSPYDRSRTSYMVHSVPEEEVENVTMKLRERAEYLFVTSACERFYEGFGPSWDRFVAAMEKPLGRR